MAKTYNDANKNLETIYLDENGSPVNTTDNYAIRLNEYDADGNVSFEASYEADGTLFITKQGYAATRKYYNDKKKLVRTEYLDENGNLITTTDGYAITASDYDTEGREIYQAWYDASGMRVAKKDNSAFLTKEYLTDGDLSIVRTRYYGADGGSVAITNGYAVLDVYNNAAGKKVGEAYFDANLNPVVRSKQDYVRYTIETRDDGVTVTTYYSAAGAVVKTEEK